MIKVMIVDDQTLMRDGLKTILELEDDIEVVAVAQNGKIAYELIDSTNPHIILMDIRMPVLNGVEASKLIKRDYKDIKIIVLTTFDTDDLIVDALSCGVDGYMLKDIEGNCLVENIRKAYNGDTILPAKIAAKLVTKLVKNKDEKQRKSLVDFQITDRENEICDLLVEGYTNKQICERLYLSSGTVKNYISSIYSKLGVNNRTSAVLFLKKFL